MTAAISSFYDTNILLYAVDGHPGCSSKRKIAIGLMLRTDFGVSAQVLAEFYYNATRKLATPLPNEEARAFIESISRDQSIVPVDAALVLTGIDLAQRYQISYWDAAIVAAAQRLEAGVLFSEDLSAGQNYGNVRVVNPFVD